MIVRGSELDNISHKSVDSHTPVDSMFFGIVYTEISFWGGKKKKKALLKGNIGSFTIEGNKQTEWYKDIVEMFTSLKIIEDIFDEHFAVPLFPCPL